ncbi:MAG: DUF2911 domain-containing protein [Flavobacteriaceae bacterium]|nr:DUF2911 domain-containing protein [Flavobacteriaceae bacterium]
MRSIFFTILFLTSYFNYSQIKTPRVSPASEIEQMVGLTEIEVEYSRPSKRGRDIFGNVVPFGKIWRTGADNCTTISFSTDVVFNSNTSIDGVKISKTKIIKAGKYSIFSIPNEESWDVILYSDTDLWGVPRDWDENKIVFKSNYQINKSANSSVKEMFTISFDNVTNNDVDMMFSWDDISVTVNIVVPTRRIVSDNIKKVMGGSPSPSDYYSAAVYYKQENINMDTALKWINKAIDLFENPRFYQLRQQSLIMAANKKYSDAIAVAKESLRLSIEADNKDYVKMNKESISEWTNKL